MGWFGDLFGRRPPEVWASTPPFVALDKKERNLVTGLMRKKELAAGEVAYSEGDSAKDLVVVVSGELELVKREGASKREHQIGRVGVGETLGEYALIDGEPRAATVRALERSEVLVLPFSELRDRAARESGMEQRVFSKLQVGLLDLLARRLRAQDQISLEHAQAREVMGQFIVNVLILICAYVLFLNALPLFRDRIPASTSALSIPLIVLFGYVSWRFIRSSGYPLSHFGIGFRHLLPSLFEAFLFTLPFLALVTGLKAVLVWWLQTPGVSIIEHPDLRARVTDAQLLPLFGIYAASSLVQELIVRGALQSSLELFLVGSGKRARAIVVCALLFAISHLHISYLFALLAIVPGLFWGWLFSRRPNLLGVWLSHVAVGSYAFFILGINV